MLGVGGTWQAIKNHICLIVYWSVLRNWFYCEISFSLNAVLTGEPQSDSENSQTCQTILFGLKLLFSNLLSVKPENVNASSFLF